MIVKIYIFTHQISHPVTINAPGCITGGKLRCFYLQIHPTTTHTKWLYKKTTEFTFYLYKLQTHLSKTN